MYRIKITFGEVLVSIAIALAMIAIGLFISNKIVISMKTSNEKYSSAVKYEEDEQELFKYAMETNVGMSIVHGKFEAIDTVSLDELATNYMYIVCKKEKYVEKTRTVTYEDSEGNTHTRIETYEEWDYCGSNTYKNEKVKFMGIPFDTAKFDFSSYCVSLKLDSKNIAPKYANNVIGNYYYDRVKDTWFGTSKTGDLLGNVRYSYKIIPLSFSGTVFVNLRDDSIYPVDESVIKVHNKSIASYLESVESSINSANIAFWFFWILFTMGLIVLFVYQRNKWLDM